MREGTYSKLQLVLNCKYQTHFKCVPSIEQRATVSGWIYFFCSMRSHSLPFLNCFNLFVKYEWEFWESCVVHSSSIYLLWEWMTCQEQIGLASPLCSLTLFCYELIFEWAAPASTIYFTWIFHSTCRWMYLTCIDKSNREPYRIECFENYANFETIFKKKVKISNPFLK